MATAKLIKNDAFEELLRLEDNSIDGVITDPPYFLDGMGDTWEESTLNKEKDENAVIKSLRKGMKFDPQQGLDFQNFMNRVAVIALDKIKPGGWFVSFSAPRLYHRLAVGVEDAGFEIRDMWEWLYTQNQMKAMGLSRFIEDDNDLSKEKIEKLKKDLQTWKTPQVKSCFEPIVLAQKPREGTFYENWKKYNIGLVRVKDGNSNSTTANVVTTDRISEVLDKSFLVGKPTFKEKGKDTTHLSVKPLALMRHIIECLIPENGLVVDPFNGSGTTGIASLAIGRNFIGFDNNDRYFEESKKRMLEYYTLVKDGEHSLTFEGKSRKSLF